jgi:L-alanine-DL-glutamate epimerase-like enolase superfamily enzyme
VPPVGFSTVKMKVCGDPAAEAERVKEAALLPGTALRFDANRCWSFEEAVRFAHEVEGLNVEFFEEPTYELASLAGWHSETGIPLALDETVLEGGDLSCADVLVLKPTLLGGWEACGRLAARGLPVVVSACFESGVGIHALACMADELQGAGTAAGLDTHAALAEDLVSGLPFGDGFVEIGGMPPEILWDELAK